VQRKPSWDRYVLTIDFGSFDEKMQKKTMKNVLFDTLLGVYFLKLDRIDEMINAKTRSRFYKSLIKGEKAQCTTRGLKNWG